MGFAAGSTVLVGAMLVAEPQWRRRIEWLRLMPGRLAGGLSGSAIGCLGLAAGLAGAMLTAAAAVRNL